MFNISLDQFPGGGDVGKAVVKVVLEGFDRYQQAANDSIKATVALRQKTTDAFDRLEIFMSTYPSLSANDTKNLKEFREECDKTVTSLNDAWNEFIVLASAPVKSIKDFYSVGPGKIVPGGAEAADVIWGAGWMMEHLAWQGNVDAYHKALGSYANMTGEKYLSNLQILSGMLTAHHLQLLQFYKPTIGTKAKPRHTTPSDFVQMMASPIGPYLTNDVLDEMSRGFNIVISVHVGLARWHADMVDRFRGLLSKAGVDITPGPEASPQRLDSGARSGRLGLGLLCTLVSTVMLLLQ